MSFNLWYFVMETDVLYENDLQITFYSGITLLKSTIGKIKRSTFNKGGYVFVAYVPTLKSLGCSFDY